MATEYTAHAREQMRSRDVTEAEVEEVLSDPEAVDHDRAGNPKFIGRVGGRGILVVVVRGASPRRVKTVIAFGHRR